MICACDLKQIDMAKIKKAREMMGWIVLQAESVISQRRIGYDIPEYNKPQRGGAAYGV